MVINDKKKAIAANQPDIVNLDKKAKICLFIDAEIPDDVNLYKTKQTW